MKKNLQTLLAEINASLLARIDNLNISKCEFCRKAGIHRNTLYGMKNPRIATLQKIEETLRKLGA